jgi:hypothetical protein
LCQFLLHKCSQLRLAARSARHGSAHGTPDEAPTKLGIVTGPKSTATGILTKPSVLLPSIQAFFARFQPESRVSVSLAIRNGGF